MIDSTLAKEGVPHVMITSTKRAMAKELIDDLLFESSMDNYQIELNKEIEKVFGGVKQEFRDMSIKMTKEQIEQLIKIEPQIREKDTDKADTLLKIIDSMKNSFSYEILYNAIKDRKLGKIRKIDLEKPEKIYNRFNRLYETSVYNIYDLKLLPDILRKILPEDISIENIHKFLIYFCKYCDMNNLNPAVLEEHAFMYYSILNIILLSLSSKSEEEDNTTEEIVENITKVIKLFD